MPVKTGIQELCGATEPGFRLRRNDSKSDRSCKKQLHDNENTFISVDEHVQEHPEVWTKRLSRQKWGERMPHIGKKCRRQRALVDRRAGDLRWTASPIAAR